MFRAIFRKTVLGLLLVGTVGSLRCGFEHDASSVIATASDLAGANAIDCGFFDGFAVSPKVSAEEVRTCMRTALEEGHPFFASVSPMSADGGTTIGFASDGLKLWRVKHDYAEAFMGGCDYESFTETECKQFKDKGADCNGHYLCFSCVEK